MRLPIREPADSIHMDFQSAATQQLRFGWGSVAELPSWVRAYGQRLLLVRGSCEARNAAQRQALVEGGCEVAEFAVAHEPDVPMIDAALAAARDHRPGALSGSYSGSPRESKTW